MFSLILIVAILAALFVFRKRIAVWFDTEAPALEADFKAAEDKVAGKAPVSPAPTPKA